ncbi:hypothetical protein [Candidatus Phytoplasma fraxini]|uniref:Uncharacterized protein n=1 Tax=Ash yellows phytoplasma TaxID=35780 RepID=A0ABZ2UBY4_ASHYP
MQNIINYNNNYKKKFYKWFLVIINDIFLAFTIYFFFIGPKLNNGGLDGLSLLTNQIINFFFQIVYPIPKFLIYGYLFLFFCLIY